MPAPLSFTPIPDPATTKLLLALATGAVGTLTLLYVHKNADKIATRFNHTYKALRYQYLSRLPLPVPDPAKFNGLMLCHGSTHEGLGPTPTPAPTRGPPCCIHNTAILAPSELPRADSAIITMDIDPDTKPTVVRDVTLPDSLKFPPASFDVIILTQCECHCQAVIEQIDDIIDRLLPCLKPTGSLYIRWTSDCDLRVGDYDMIDNTIYTIKSISYYLSVDGSGRTHRYIKFGRQN